MINVPAGGQGDTPTDTSGGGSAEDQPLELLARMISDAKRYIDVEPDAEDRATMGTVLRTLLQYQAKDQRDREAALGGGPATRLIRKAAGV